MENLIDKIYLMTQDEAKKFIRFYKSNKYWIKNGSKWIGVNKESEVKEYLHKQNIYW